MTEIGKTRRERLQAARVYFVAEGSVPEAVLRAALDAGVDMLQLRDKQAADDELLQAAALFRSLCDEHEALFWLNDRPDLVAEAHADGVHVGQEDQSVAEVRAAVGADVLIGLSTHSPEQLDAALESDADQISVGPVYETPTKEGRPATGLGYVSYAAQRVGGSRPWFAIGGITRGNVGDVVAAGAGRIVVVRAIRDADDPAAAARELRAALKGRPVGTAQ